MKILLDAHMAGERESGNERYILNLLRALLLLDRPVELTVAATQPAVVESAVPPGRACRIEQVSASPWFRLGRDLPRLAERAGAAVLQVTYAGPFHVCCPVVAAVHDVSYLAHPEWFSLRDRAVLRLGVGLTLKRGAAVITLSEHARTEIRGRYGLAANRVVAIPPAADPVFTLRAAATPPSDRLRRHGLRGPFILAVGNVQPRKNLARLVEAYARLRQAGGDYQLAIVGQARWQASKLYALIARLGLTQEVVFTGYLADHELVELYRQAVVFVYPSLYEGFGLPVIEAMACGAPVVCSRAAALPEAAGEAAVLVDPLDVAALADTLQALLADSARRAQLRELGLRRAAQFTWERTALQTWDFYQRVAAREL